MSRNVTRSLWLGLAFMAFFSVPACSGDYGIDLPNGYELSRIYAGAVLIGSKRELGGTRIEANIDGYAVLGDLVVGHVTVAEHSPEREMCVPGYFILNTVTHERNQGLTKQVWLDALQALGISSEPELIKPRR